MNLRLLTEADAASSTLISQHAFGLPTDGRPAFTIGPEMRRWGIFDGETLVAKANDRAYDSWIGGRRVPTAGVAGVVVAPEYRGAGLARQVMTHLLHTARDRGAVIATLFRTAPALYRSLGFEQVAELVDGSLPTSALRGIRPAHTTLRRATAEDATSIRNIYARVAASGSCLLARDGAAFEVGDRELIAATDGVTLAIDENGGAVGYVSWNRGSGYGGSAILSVVDLLAVTGDGYQALLSAVGSFHAVTPTVRLRTSGTDPIQWLLWNSGRHRLVLDAGSGRLEPAGADGDATTVTVPGLALLYAGGVTVSTLRRSGLVGGGSPASDAVLDASFAGPRPAVMDYF